MDIAQHYPTAMEIAQFFRIQWIWLNISHRILHGFFTVLSTDY